MECILKISKPVNRALNFKFDACRCVAHPAGQMQLMGEPVYEWPEADPLDDSADFIVCAG